MRTEMNSSANCLASGIQVGEYRLQGVVGEGGFGIVYQARDLSLDRVVAIKEYMPSALAGRTTANQVHVRAQHRGAFDAGLRSFINEARLLAKFSHPALVHVYRFFEANGTAYMVMRYYEGQTFRAFLNQQQAVIDEHWLSIMLGPILDVLEMLHAADCYHRDIAPDNIFLQSSGVPVLLDFGAARRIIGDMTQALTMVLKPGFAPIEQYVDDGAMPQGAWTDIYQLGATLYLAITGKPPATSVARMINDPMPVLKQQDYPGFSAQFLQGVQRALAVKPQDRPQSIAEFRDLLGMRVFTVPAPLPWPVTNNTTPESLREPPTTVDAAVGAVGTPVTVTAPSVQEPRQEEIASGLLDGLIGTGAADLAPLEQSPILAEGPQTVDAPQVGHPAKQDLDMPPKQTDVVGKVSPIVPEATTHAPKEPKKNTPEHQVLPPKSKGGASPKATPSVAKRSRVLPVAGGLLLAVLVLAGWWWAQSTPAEVAAPVVADVQATKEEPFEEILTDSPQSPASAPGELGHVAISPLPAASAASHTAPPVPVESVTPPVASVQPPPVVSPVVAPVVPPVRPVAAKEGLVYLRIMPWGNVTVDRVSAGTTPPLTQLKLSEGTHQIEISNPAAPAFTQTVQVKKDAPVTLSHKFE